MVIAEFLQRHSYEGVMNWLVRDHEAINEQMNWYFAERNKFPNDLNLKLEMNAHIQLYHFAQAVKCELYREHKEMFAKW